MTVFLVIALLVVITCSVVLAMAAERKVRVKNEEIKRLERELQGVKSRLEQYNSALKRLYRNSLKEAEQARSKEQ